MYFPTKEHEIAYNTVEEYLQKDFFTFDELQEEVIQRGGIQRIGTGYTIGEFIEDLQKEDRLKFDSKSKVFVPKKENSLENKTKG